MDIIQIITLVYLSGILSAPYISINPIIIAIISAILGIAAVIFKHSEKFFTFLICLFAFFTSVFMCGADQIIDNNTSFGEYIKLQNSQDEIQKVYGTVIEAKQKNEESYEFVILVKYIRTGPDITIPVRGKVQVNAWGEDLFKPEYGDNVEVEGWIKSIGGMKAKSRIFYRRKGIAGRLYLAKNGVHIITGKGNVPPVMAFGKHLRDKFINTLSSRVGGDESAVMGRMLLGKEMPASASVEEYFRRSGISHLLVVSGMHVWFMMSAFIALSFLWSRRPIITFSVLVCVLVFYYGLTGGGPSITRATIMGVIFLCGLLRGSGYRADRAIFLAALLMMIMDPMCVYSIGVQLTFLASAGVIFIYPLLLLFLTESKHPNFFVKGALISISAQLPIFPIIAYYFNNFCLISPVSNLVIVPMAGLLLPASLLTCISGLLPQIFIPLTVCFAFFSKLISYIMIHSAIIFSGIPFSNFQTASPSFAWIVLYEIALIFLIFVIRQSYYGTDEKAETGFFILSSLIFLLILPFVWNPPFTGISSAFIDVGQGDSTFVEIKETPGKSFKMLIDGGGSWGYAEDLYDPGERAVGSFLKKHGVSRLDALILSHSEADHMNGLLWVAKNIQVENFLDTGIPKNIVCEVYVEHPYCNHETIEPVKLMPESQQRIYKELLTLLKKNGTEYINIRAGARFSTGNSGIISVLSPDIPLLKSGNTIISSNNYSAVLKVEYGKNSVLITGDIEKPVESRLVMYQGENINSSLLKSPHHGSSTSSTINFLESVSPKTVVISTGGPAFYGHPHPSTLKNYADAGLNIFRTDENGTVECRISGNENIRCSSEIVE